MVPVLPWLRLNLSLLVLVTGMVSGAFGAMITTVTFIGDMKHLVADRGVILANHADDLKSLHKDMTDVDRRLNEEKTVVEEQRRVRDNQVAILEQRIAVLEAQLRFFADRSPPPRVGSRP